MDPKLADVIGSCPLFTGLSRDTCAQLAALCKAKTLRRRETLFLEQTRGRSLFLLLEGRMALSKTTAEGSEVAIRTVKPGESFAEVILFEEDRYPVTATALTPARVLAFDRNDILRLLDQRAFRNEFMAMLMRKQRYLAERVRYLGACDVEQRFVLFLREQFGESAAITPAISKKDTAAAIGAMPETFSRLLGRLARQNLLRWRGGVIRVRPEFWQKA